MAKVGKPGWRRAVRSASWHRAGDNPAAKCLGSHDGTPLLLGSSGLGVHPQSNCAPTTTKGAALPHPCPSLPALLPSPARSREPGRGAETSSSTAGCHRRCGNVVCPRTQSLTCTSRGAEGPETLSQCSFPDHQLPARTSARPLSFSAPPADCWDNPRCFLCRSLPPQSLAWWWDKPCPSRACGSGADAGSRPLLCSQKHQPNPVRVYGSVGLGGTLSSLLPSPHLSVLLLPSCPCVSAQPPCSPPSPTPLPVSGRGDAISLSGSLQMDVVYTFQTGASSLQGALRRQPSIVSQHHDVKNVSSPTHVALSSVNSTPTTSAVAAAAASPPAGSE